MASRHPYASSVSQVLRELEEFQTMDYESAYYGFDGDLLLADLDQAGRWGTSANNNEPNHDPSSADQRPTKKQRTDRSMHEGAIPAVHTPHRNTDLDSNAVQQQQQRASKGLPVLIDLTEDDHPLTEILEIFPDIDPDYLKGLIDRHLALVSQAKTEILLTATDKDLAKGAVIEEILQNPSYPKKQKRLKRTLDERDSVSKKEDDTQKWLKAIPQRGSPLYLEITARLLAIEFPTVPWPYIQNLTLHKRELYAAYLSLYALEDPSAKSSKPYTNERKRNPRSQTSLYMSYPETLPIMKDIQRELQAAAEAAKQNKEMNAAVPRNNFEDVDDKEAEERNIQTGNLVECQCCFEEVPANKALPCEGLEVHFFCYTCMKSSAETQIGMMRYKLQCFDGSGCQAKFDRYGLERALGAKIMQKLDALQQQDEIEQAGLEGLESCPFCDFQAICAPADEDREFRCRNPDCEVVSCRLCKEKSHLPSSCDEARKDKRLPYRHRVEEALSEALIRPCPTCKVKIVKTDGCNKMTCSKCGTQMCYVCNVKLGATYEHFNRPPNHCRLWDQNERFPLGRQVEQEIEQVEADAIAKILAENPDVTEEEIRVNRPGQKQKARPPRPGRPQNRHARPPQPDRARQPVQPQVRLNIQVPRIPQPNQPRQPMQAPQHIQAPRVIRQADPANVPFREPYNNHVQAQTNREPPDRNYYANRIQDIYAGGLPWNAPGNNYPLPNPQINQINPGEAGFLPQGHPPNNPVVMPIDPPPYYSWNQGQAVPMAPRFPRQNVVNNPAPNPVGPGQTIQYPPYYVPPVVSQNARRASGGLGGYARD
ncbi:uncharacterized protein BO72DRAFT_446516 [Aspergillus fijiensis CBS 313.89]|uniref:RING-type domain-containing protein n=1 Tax=Aspergillus fijiensis CBS 313.89 TaxID=1448319 RepID=A0A8G1RU12_9EURO|nr:uncharacterized protein BO72DRAFT_446516 [Aspergillus fijiensis CBS 313.89]RAK79239.1 hypothetical protein BO72DRAFT_446516 [Aspergillus fijiensis CBS 313.89]